MPDTCVGHNTQVTIQLLQLSCEVEFTIAMALNLKILAAYTVYHRAAANISTRVFIFRTYALLDHNSINSLLFI